MFHFRIKLLKQEIIDQTKSILENLYEPAVIDHFVRSVDIFNKRVIDYMEEYDSFSLMETKVMDGAIKKMWTGSIDTGGSFFALSINYKVLTKEASFDYMKDYERTHRLHCRRSIENVRHHKFTFNVYKKSMILRYYVELLLYIILVASFQYYILGYITIW